MAERPELAFMSLVPILLLFAASPTQAQIPPPSQYPEITGPDTVTDNENNTWTCVVDGALPAATIRWRIGATNVYTNGVTHPTTENSEGLFRTSSSISNVFLSSDGIAQIHCDMEHDTGARKTATKNVQVQYKPIITSTPTSYTATEGVTQRLECSINAVPTATVVGWLKGNKAVDRSFGKYSGGNSLSNLDLNIVNPQKEDSGVYVCTATNILGSTNGPDVTVTVRYAPRNIQVNPQSVRVDVGQAVTVSCSADGVPTPTYAWYFESNTQAVSTGQTLSIPSAQPADNGQYTCLATNTKGNASIVVAVSVWYAPILTTNTSPQAVDEGSTLTLKCTIDANPFTYSISWLKDGSEVDRTNTRLSGGTDSITPDLTITNIQSVDAGSYRCRVTHVVATSRSDIVDVQIAFPPRNIVLNPADPVINLNEGDALNLTCSVDAVPTPTITWKAGSTVIRSGSSLVIASAGPVDNSEVTCEVSNSKGQTTKKTRINVSYTPRVTIPGGAGVDEGNSLTIPCIVDSNPADDTFDWLRDSNILDLTDNAKYGGGTRKSRNLTIYSLASSDAGNYSCRSVNSVGTDTSREVIVTISYKPRGSDINPVFRTTVGTPVTLTCQVIANPSATDYSWSFGGVDLNDTGSRLVVTPGDDSDFGQYTCQATNTVGNSGPIILTLLEGSTNRPRSTTTLPDNLTTQPDSETILATGIGIGVIVTLVILSVMMIVIFRRKVATCLHGQKDSQRAPSVQEEYASHLGGQESASPEGDVHLTALNHYEELRERTTENQNSYQQLNVQESGSHFERQETAPIEGDVHLTALNHYEELRERTTENQNSYEQLKYSREIEI